MDDQDARSDRARCEPPNETIMIQLGIDDIVPIRSGRRRRRRLSESTRGGQALNDTFGWWALSLVGFALSSVGGLGRRIAWIGLPADHLEAYCRLKKKSRTFRRRS